MMNKFKRITAQSYSVLGGSTPIKAALVDYRREYIMLYAMLGTCYITIGKYDVDNEIAITEGTTFELNKVLLNEIWYRGENSSMVVVTDSVMPHPPPPPPLEYLIYDGQNLFIPDSTIHLLKEFQD